MIAICSGTHRCTAREAWGAGRRQSLAQGWDGAANPVQAPARSRGALRIWQEQSDGSGCYSVLEPQKDRSIASIKFDALCSAARNARASRQSSTATRPYGTAALRGPAATGPDTPARCAAGDRRPAAAP
jgi:hypothetical protein